MQEYPFRILLVEVQHHALRGRPHIWRGGQDGGACDLSSCRGKCFLDGVMIFGKLLHFGQLSPINFFEVTFQGTKSYSAVSNRVTT
jgi:hypothetical protein